MDYDESRGVLKDVVPKAVSSDYKEAAADAVLWLLRNYNDYKPEYLAEYMLLELLGE